MKNKIYLENKVQKQCILNLFKDENDLITGIIDPFLEIKEISQNVLEVSVLLIKSDKTKFESTYYFYKNQTYISLNCDERN